MLFQLITSFLLPTVMGAVVFLTLFFVTRECLVRLNAKQERDSSLHFKNVKLNGSMNTAGSPSSQEKTT